MTADTPNEVDKNVIDLYGNPFYAALAHVVETLRHAPYWHSEEKAPTRLDRARELVRNSRVLLQDERLATVYGSTKLYDVTGFHCTCPQSQKGQSSWCVHSVAVKLARTLAAQATPAPVALGTLRAGTLPLPPVTVDERLAQAPPEADLPLIAPREEGPVYTSSDGTRYTLESRPYLQPSTPEGEGRPDDHRVALGTLHDSTALQTHHMPQEDRMPDDDQYIEPDEQDAPVTVLDAADADFPPMGQPAIPRQVPAPVLLPALDARTLEQSMQAWAAQRAVVTRYIKEQMTEGVDYYTLTIKGRVSKATLSKAGSEKFLSLFQLHAQFHQDTATWQMLGSKDGLLCYICHLVTRSGEVIGEGRGARSVAQDGGDINKAIKMACKSSMVDAVLRTGALSDVFTQDLEPETPAAPAPVTPNPLHPAAELRQRIWARVQEVAPEATTREAVTRIIMEKTGLALHPDHYREILAKLGA